MAKKIILSLVLFIVIYGICTAQTAEKVEEIINSEFLSKGQACYLIGTATGKVNDNESYDEAFKSYSDLKMFKNASANEPIKLSEFSNLVLQNAGSRGGLWYRVTKTPHYALRYFKLKGIVRQNAVGSEPITIAQAFDILAKIEIADNFEGEIRNEKK